MPDDQFPDVYTMSELDEYPGARERSRPYSTEGEETYEKVIDASGRLISTKPANRAFLRAQQARAARASQPPPPPPPDPTLLGSLLRTLLILLLFLPLLSQFTTSTWHFNALPTLRPYLRQLQRHRLNPFKAPLREFTPVQLAAYDGSDAEREVLLGLDGLVFDVSGGRRLYGPGGSYHFMAGRDAARSFVTGCFETHLTHDLRGLTEADLKSLESWKSFFLDHPTYTLVGTVLNPPIDPASPVPPPCRPSDTPGEDAARHGAHKPGPVQEVGKGTGGQRAHREL